jgi:malate/lactate dehydrogenase
MIFNFIDFFFVIDVKYAVWKMRGLQRKSSCTHDVALDRARVCVCVCVVISGRLVVAPQSVHGWAIGEHTITLAPFDHAVIRIVKNLVLKYANI